MIFAPGEHPEQVTIGQGAESFGTFAVIVQAVVREDARLMPAVLPLQPLALSFEDLKTAVPKPRRNRRS